MHTCFLSTDIGDNISLPPLSYPTLQYTVVIGETLLMYNREKIFIIYITVKYNISLDLFYYTLAQVKLICIKSLQLE